MSLKRTSTCVLLVGLGGAVGCTRYPTLKTVPIECSAEDGYDFKAIDSCYWWGSGDNTLKPDAANSVVRVETKSLTDAGFQCGSTTPLVFYSSYNNDWGSLYGCSGFGVRDVHDYEGLSFWARAPAGTSNGFSIWLDDLNTARLDDSDAGGHCNDYKTDGGISGYTTLFDPNSGLPVPGGTTSSKLPDQCGNGYGTVMVVATDWRFYTIPFSQLMQSALPNRVPNSDLTQVGSTPGTTLLTNALTGLGMRLPSEAQMELWMDKLSFYRKKGPVMAGEDGGTGSGGRGGATAGTGGAAGGAGSGGTYPPNEGVSCPLPTDALITDFAYAPAVDGGTAATDFVHFGDSTTLAGSESVYPTAASGSSYPLTSNVTNSDWHISGTVGDYSGFNVYFDNCSRIDASKYKGISFTISGSVPGTGTSTNMVTMGIGTLADTVASSWLDAKGVGTGAVTPGRCVPTSGTNKYDQSTCKDPVKIIPVAAAPTVQNILWTDFTGGKPEPNVTPTDIVSIYWFLPFQSGITAYPIDIVIDDLKFIE